MKKRDLKAQIVELEARIAELERDLEIARQYADMMRGYQPPYQYPGYIWPGDPGYMPAFNPHPVTTWSSGGKSIWLHRETLTNDPH